MASIYEANPDYLQSPRWKWIRRWRLFLDDNRCRACHGTRNLHIHHASYVWFNRWWGVGMVMELLDTITLCSKCHGGVHGAQRIEEFRD